MWGEASERPAKDPKWSTPPPPPRSAPSPKAVCLLVTWEHVTVQIPPSRFLPRTGPCPPCRSVIAFPSPVSWNRPPTFFFFSFLQSIQSFVLVYNCGQRHKTSNKPLQLSKVHSSTSRSCATLSAVQFQSCVTTSENPHLRSGCAPCLTPSPEPLAAPRQLPLSPAVPVLGISRERNHTRCRFLGLDSFPECVLEVRPHCGGVRTSFLFKAE